MTYTVNAKGHLFMITETFEKKELYIDGDLIFTINYVARNVWYNKNSKFKKFIVRTMQRLLDKLTTGIYLHKYHINEKDGRVYSMMLHNYCMSAKEVEARFELMKPEWEKL